jgi:hypothetical protein
MRMSDRFRKLSRSTCTLFEQRWLQKWEDYGVNVVLLLRALC